MEINRLIFLTIRKWWLIVLCAVMGGGIGFLFVSFEQPVYEADTSLYIMQNDQNMDAIDNFTFSKYLVDQYSQIISSRTVATAILQNIHGYTITEKQLLSMIEISTNENSNIFTIKATGPDPVLTAAIANATARQFTLELNKITKRDAVGILDEALTPNNPIPNNLIAKVLLGGLFGLVLAIAIIYFIDYFDTSIRSVEDIQSLNLHVIGIIPEHDIH